MKLSSVGRSVMVLVLFLLSLPVYGVEEERRRGSLGVGVLLGEPTGLTGKLWIQRNRAIDGLAAWSLDSRQNFFYVQSHYLFHFEETVEDKQFVFYAGPGGYVRLGNVRDRLGVSGNFGIAYTISQFEVFLELSPKVSIIPDTDGDLTGGLGFHYYF